MILWINGPYGVGKSTLAEALMEKLPDSFLFDAELVGDAVRENMPKAFFKETYEEYPLWHELCFCLLKNLAETYDGHVFVPMTLKQSASVEGILDRLRESGMSTAHVMLEADHDTVHDRILQRGEEEDCWCMQNIFSCQTAQRDLPADLRLNTADKSPAELADEVIQIFNLR